MSALGTTFELFSTFLNPCREWLMALTNYLRFNETVLPDRPLPRLSSDQHDSLQAIKLELIPFNPFSRHNIPGFIMFCNVSKPFDFALIRPLRPAAFDLD